MQIHIKATKLDLTPAVHEYIERRIGSLEQYLGRFERKKQVHIYIEIARSTKHHKSGNVFYAEATTNVAGKKLRVERYAEDIRTAIDDVKDVLKRDIRKIKEKQVDKKRGLRRALKPKH